jgi:hypothetical protein
MRSSPLYDMNLILIQKFYLKNFKKFNIFIRMTNN